MLELSAEQGILPESQAELVPEAATILEGMQPQWSQLPLIQKTDYLNRAVRASLDPRQPATPDELYGSHTNCFGAVRALGQAASGFGVEVRPAIVVRYPWQEQQAFREIHIVGVASSDHEAVVADPMPLPSYSCGVTRPASVAGKDVVAEDRVLGGEINYRLLEDAELLAIAQVFEADMLANDPSQYIRAGELLMGAYEQLAHIPPYRVRIAKTLYAMEYNRLATRLIGLEPPEHILRSYARFLHPSKARAVRELADQDVACQLAVTPRILGALVTAQTQGDINYWLRMYDDFQHDRGGLHIPGISMRFSPRAFQPREAWQGSVMAYESAMSTYWPGYTRSNLYTPDWLAPVFAAQ